MGKMSRKTPVVGDLKSSTNRRRVRNNKRKISFRTIAIVCCCFIGVALICFRVFHAPDLVISAISKAFRTAIFVASGLYAITRIKPIEVVIDRFDPSIVTLVMILLIIGSGVVSATADLKSNDQKSIPAMATPDIPTQEQITPLRIFDIDKPGPLYKDGELSAETTADGIINSLDDISEITPQARGVILKFTDQNCDATRELLGLQFDSASRHTETYMDINNLIFTVKYNQAKKEYKKDPYGITWKHKLDAIIESALEIKQILFDQGERDWDFCRQIALRYREEVDWYVGNSDLINAIDQAKKEEMMLWRTLKCALENGKQGEVRGCLERIRDFYQRETKENDVFSNTLMAREKTTYEAWETMLDAVKIVLAKQH